MAKKRGEDYATTLKVLREYNDGYLFFPDQQRLYNPYSVLRTLKSREVDPFWFETGTPSFLVNQIQSDSIYPGDFDVRICSKRELMRVRVGSKDPIPLMFQTGYLTIDHYDADLDAYTLRFPNREVEISFAEDLLPMYIHEADDSGSPMNVHYFRRDLFSGNPDTFMQRLSTAIKDIPGEDQCEAVYRAATYLLCKLCSLQAIAEHHGYKGRSDLEVFTSRYIYVFEFKYNRNVNEAMEQIRDRDYVGRYAMDSRTIFLIGANFENTKDNRELSYEIRKIKDYR